ncbi:MAG: L-2-amino-thiazoline-4-carboxylic acid hydrolase [Synergistes jonesii]|uniref:L-2-amino-thiazoline-4-carboxylic acid hydrolase n=1 Tax=Synergistes jonesii TaxID=2754 RepID=UPI002A74CCDF|nr:L-2-amino-thiazoline-4-carboxylic acid hydrolase [Synergistes jonesii]MDY2984475.1 L-2-amino-thiazoline-4-carboxylic acid hydrolase [Synergistes jonesii]
MEKCNEVPLLSQREIEAKVIAPLIRAFAAEIGDERARLVAKEAMKKISRAQGEAVAEKFGGGLESLKNNCISAWHSGGELEIEEKKDNEREYSFNVKRCAYAELYEKLGCRELGAVISCSRDFAFLDGFDRGLELTRTKTLMEGGDCCDFCYRKK